MLLSISLRNYVTAVTLSLLWFFAAGLAQADVQLSLSNIMDLKVTVATKTERTLTEAPSSITIITREDIARNMCRDMVDVINLIPGLSVSKDLDWDLGLGARGIYGFEGRSLIMVDGMQVSGLYFGSFLLGNEIPVHMIDRIEIIRGPGSVLYGGIAELATIDIKTSNRAMDSGTKVFARYGTMQKSFGHRDVGVQYARKADSNDSLSYSLAAFAGDAVASNSNYGFFGNVAEKKASKQTQYIRDHYVAMGNVGFRGTAAKFYVNQFVQEYLRKNLDDNDQYEEIRSDYDQIERNFNLEHKINLGEKFSITPSYDYQYSLEWGYHNTTTREIERHKPSVVGLYKDDSIELLVGGEYFVDAAQLRKNKNDPSIHGFYKSRTDSTLSDDVEIENYASFAGLTYFWQGYSAFAGIRYDKNESYGDATSPRLGFTGKFGPMHSKLIYSEAFRAPLIGNNAYRQFGIDPTKPWRDDVLPEKTKVWELELGYKISNDMILTTNFYDQKIKKMIEFYYNGDVNDTDGDGEPDGDLYSKNGGAIGTRGVEAEFKYVSAKLRSTINFSQSVLTEDRALSYIAGHNKAIMGIPSQKGHLNLSYSLSPAYVLNFNQNYIGKTATMAVLFCDGADDKTCTKDNSPQQLSDIGVLWRKPKSRFEAALTVHDIFDKGQRVSTAYLDSLADDFLWKGREVSINSTVQF